MSNLPAPLELVIKISWPLILTYATARLGAVLLPILRPNRSTDAEDLTNFISFTSRLIAAYRCASLRLCKTVSLFDFTLHRCRVA